MYVNVLNSLLFLFVVALSDEELRKTFNHITHVCNIYMTIKELLISPLLKHLVQDLLLKGG